MKRTVIEQVNPNFFLTNFFLCEGEPAEEKGPKRKKWGGVVA